MDKKKAGKKKYRETKDNWTNRKQQNGSLSPVGGHAGCKFACH